MRRNRSPLMDDIPVLTDSVPEVRPVDPRAAAASRRNPRAGRARCADTIPMLPSASPSALSAGTRRSAPPAAVVEEGEPSDWLQLGGAEPSVIGDAPDSIAIVPPLRAGRGEEIDVEAPPEPEERSS